MYQPPNPNPTIKMGERLTEPLKTSLVRLEPEEVPTPPPPEEDTEDIPTLTEAYLREQTLSPPLPPEVPLYMRNPGKPPRLPGNIDFESFGRTSYRVKETEFGYNNHGLLRICAVVGVCLIVILVIFRPQNRTLEATSNQSKAAQTTPVITKSALSAVTTTEQYAVVIAQEGLILEEPRAGATIVQTLQQYTYLGFQRKSSAGWYELKGGAGWISAKLVKTYATEEEAWNFKREMEKPTVTPTDTDS